MIVIPVMKILFPIFAPWRALRGDGRYPVKTQAGSVPTKSSVEESLPLPV